MIINKTPLRLSLSGGGSDLPIYFKKIKSNVLNFAINLYITTIIKKHKNKGVIFNSLDLKKKKKLEKIKSSKDDYYLASKVYNFICEKYKKDKNNNIEIISFSDVPVGSGLGGSSSITVSLYMCLCEYFKIKVAKQTVIKDTYFIERVLCQKKGGIQDYYPAVYGGLLHLFFHKNKKTFKHLEIKDNLKLFLDTSSIVFFSGSSRVSDIVISDQINNFKKNLKYFRKISENTAKFTKLIEKGNFSETLKLINEGNALKKNTSNLIETKVIKSIIKKINKHIYAYRISGAGGGGFILLFFKPQNKLKITKILSNNKLSFFNVSILERGSYTSRINI